MIGMLTILLPFKLVIKYQMHIHAKITKSLWKTKDDLPAKTGTIVPPPKVDMTDKTNEYNQYERWGCKLRTL